MVEPPVAPFDVTVSEPDVDSVSAHENVATPEALVVLVADANDVVVNVIGVAAIEAAVTSIRLPDAAFNVNVVVAGTDAM